MDSDARSLASLSKALEAQITQADANIEALTTAAKRLVGVEDFGALSTQEPHPVRQPFTEADLIVQLDKARLELLMDVQKQDYVSEKLNEMIEANDGIVRSVVDYYADVEQTRKVETEASQERLSHYTDNILGEKTAIFRENSKSLEECYNKLAESAHRTLLLVIDGQEGLLSQQDDLDELVRALNEAYSHLEMS